MEYHNKIPPDNSIIFINIPETTHIYSEIRSCFCIMIIIIILCLFLLFLFMQFLFENDWFGISLKIID